MAKGLSEYRFARRRFKQTGEQLGKCGDYLDEIRNIYIEAHPEYGKQIDDTAGLVRLAAASVVALDDLLTRM